MTDLAQLIARGYRYRLQPTPDQAERLLGFIGVTRLVYNLALEQRRDFWRQYLRTQGQRISFASQCSELTELRDAFDWIADVPVVMTTYALRDLDRAYQAFFAGRAGYPSPRKRGRNDAVRIKGRNLVVEPLNRKWATVRLPKLGWIKFRLTRPIVGRIRNATVSYAAGQWHVAFSCEHEAPSITAAQQSVGIDRGVTQALTLSNGEAIPAPPTGALWERQRRAQRVLARKKIGSGRRQAQKARVAALSARAGRIRTDWCHRASTDVARRFGVVAVEDLQIANMTASARGTAEAPGRNVRQKAGLNRSILDQCWGKFATFLDYKLTERGGRLISVPAAYTSQTCASCGVVDARSRKSQAVFACVHCDHTDNADVNAAKEILRRSTAWLDVEGRVTTPTKRQLGATQTGSPGMLKQETSEYDH